MARTKKVTTETTQTPTANLYNITVNGETTQAIIEKISDDASPFDSDFTGEEIDNNIGIVKNNHTKWDNKVNSDDSRLSDARTPKAHEHAPDDITDGLIVDSVTVKAERNPETGAYSLTAIGGGIEEAPIDNILRGRRNADWEPMEEVRQFNFRGEFQLGQMYNKNDVVSVTTENSVTEFISNVDGNVLQPPAITWDEFFRVRDGLSAYELAVEQGFVGTLDEWLESLQGEQGKRGYTTHNWATAGNVTNISQIPGMIIGDSIRNTSTATRTILGLSTAIGSIVLSTSATTGTAAGNDRGATGPQGPQGYQGPQGASGKDIIWDGSYSVSDKSQISFNLNTVLDDNPLWNYIESDGIARLIFEGYGLAIGDEETNGDTVFSIDIGVMHGGSAVTMTKYMRFIGYDGQVFEGQVMANYMPDYNDGQLDIWGIPDGDYRLIKIQRVTYYGD